jgi:predicted glutamine amidotransferase
MCRLFGAISLRPLNPAAFLTESLLSLLTQSRVDPKRLQGDGWGIGWFSGDRPRIDKSPRPLYRDAARLRQAVRRSGGNALLGHVRWASNPMKLPRRELIGLPHTQPFMWEPTFAKATVGTRPARRSFSEGGWLFVHNGTLYIPREVKAKLGPWARFVKGKNDSEVLFYWLLKHIYSLPPLWGKVRMGGPLTLTLSHKGRGSTVAAVRAAVKGLHQIWRDCRKKYPLYPYPYHGLNWVLTNGRVLMAFCYADPRGFGKSRALCAKDQPYYQMQLQQTDQSLTVASEPLDPGTPWTPLRHGELVIARPQGAKLSVKRQRIL